MIFLTLVRIKMYYFPLVNKNKLVRIKMYYFPLVNKTLEYVEGLSQTIFVQ